MYDLHSPFVIQTGWVLSWIAAIIMVADGLFGVFGQKIAPAVQRRMFEDCGFSLNQATPMGLTVMVAGILYAYPATAILGAILITGYLGGAIAATYRVKQVPPMIISALLGLMTWGGLFLRDPRISALLPVLHG